MRKIGQLLPGVIVLVFAAFCVGVYFGGGGTGQYRLSRSGHSQDETAAAVRSQIPAYSSEAAEQTEAAPDRGTDTGRKLVNINTANLETLKTLPGIGDVRAQSILDYRERNGPFLHTNDLLNVYGIGPGILENIRDLICLEDDYENLDH